MLNGFRGAKLNMWLQNPTDVEMLNGITQFAYNVAIYQVWPDNSYHCPQLTSQTENHRNGSLRGIGDWGNWSRGNNLTKYHMDHMEHVQSLRDRSILFTAHSWSLRFHMFCWGVKETRDMSLGSRNFLPLYQNLTWTSGNITTCLSELSFHWETNMLKFVHETCMLYKSLSRAQFSRSQTSNERFNRRLKSLSTNKSFPSTPGVRGKGLFYLLYGSFIGLHLRFLWHSFSEQILTDLWVIIGENSWFESIIEPTYCGRRLAQMGNQ